MNRKALSLQGQGMRVGCHAGPFLFLDLESVCPKVRPNTHESRRTKGDALPQVSLADELERTG